MSLTLKPRGKKGVFQITGTVKIIRAGKLEFDRGTKKYGHSLSRCCHAGNDR